MCFQKVRNPILSPYLDRHLTSVNTWRARLESYEDSLAALVSVASASATYLYVHDFQK